MLNDDVVEDRAWPETAYSLWFWKHPNYINRKIRSIVEVKDKLSLVVKHQLTIWKKVGKWFYSYQEAIKERMHCLDSPSD